MRGILWRGIALALAGAISWILWNWPQAKEQQEEIEFILAPSCFFEKPERAMFGDNGWQCIMDEEQEALDACENAGRNGKPLPEGCTYFE